MHSYAHTFGHDATHEGGSQHDSVGTLLIEEAAHSHLVGQIRLHF